MKGANKIQQTKNFIKNEQLSIITIICNHHPNKKSFRSPNLDGIIRDEREREREIFSIRAIFLDPAIFIFIFKLSIYLLIGR